MLAQTPRSQGAMVGQWNVLLLCLLANFIARQFGTSDAVGGGVHFIALRPYQCALPSFVSSVPTYTSTTHRITIAHLTALRDRMHQSKEPNRNSYHVHPNRTSVYASTR